MTPEIKEKLAELEELLCNVKHSPYFVFPIENGWCGTYKHREFFGDTCEEVEIDILEYIRAKTRIL